MICRAEITGKKVALSFDDGPTPERVDAVLPILEAHGTKATFFLIGESALEDAGSHDRWFRPPFAKRRIGLQDCGYEIVTVGELLRDGES